MKPGWIELTRTPSVDQCRATFFVSVRTAPLAAWYAGETPKPPLVPKIELMLMTEACSDAFRYGAAIFIPRKTPVWSMATVRSHSASVVSSMGLMSPIPALLTRMSRPPKASTALAHGRRPVLLAGDVVPEEVGPPAAPVISADRGGTAVHVDVGDQDSCPLVGQPVRGGLADSARRTCDDGDASLESVHDHSLFSAGCLLLYLLPHHHPR